VTCRTLALALAAFAAAVEEKPAARFMIRSRTRIVQRHPRATGERQLNGHTPVRLIKFDDTCEEPVKLENFPVGTIDWPKVPAVVQAGETGIATSRTVNLSDVTLRLVEYSAGYKADHWCTKGHILYVVSGNVVIEYDNEKRTNLSSGMSWHAPEGASTAHLLRCERAATVFIID
jgi:quercetin dioxygenase-like cupin family protein